MALEAAAPFPRGGAGLSRLRKLSVFLLPQHGGGLRWGKRAKIVSHRNAASPSLTSPKWGRRFSVRALHMRVPCEAGGAGKSGVLSHLGTEDIRAPFESHLALPHRA